VTPYEESVRVPLMIRSPGIAAGTVADEMVVNNDLAPTILDWSNAGAPAYMDGRSLEPLTKGFEPTWRDAIMVEHWVDIHQTGDATPPRYPSTR
jgi:N-acetylglucosamine-6-sulfatase